MQPLSDRIRPRTLADYIGQSHLVGEDKLLRRAIKSGNLFSMILWGPPGSGKTTLARVIAVEANVDFMEFSAVTTGIAELKKIFNKLKGKQLSLSSPVIFIDEIHRFNKAQQDALLPYVESGAITLIGATTENPSFEVIPPLLSRTRVFVLKAHSSEDLKLVLQRSLSDKVSGLGNLQVSFEKVALEFLIEVSSGDARVLLNTLEIAVSSKSSSKIKLARSDIEEAIQKKALLYDKAGDEHYNTISAFIKSMRASQVNAALYYLARMVEAGEDPLFIARRMVVFASEDIGMAQPTALVVANEVFRSCETIGYPECSINLAHGVVYLCLAKKDRSSYDAYQKAVDDVKRFGNLEIPLHIRNAPTKLMKSLDYGKGYQKYDPTSYLPDKLKDKVYFK